MKLHARAALTIHQREEVQRLHEEERVSIRKLARRFHVNPTTIQRWVGREAPLDKNSAPLHPRKVVTPEYRSAVIKYRRANPHHGPIRIAAELKPEFPIANRGSVLRILQEERMTRPPAREPRPQDKIPVGRHRIQMDVQQLPAVEGGKGFEYKISMIHLRTRFKYSEIHSELRSETVAAVLRRGLGRLPPFFSSGPTTP
jgi:transposase-like protein